MQEDDVAPLRLVLGRRLATWREAAHETQRSLAVQLPYSRSTVANVETGRQQAPRDFWQRCDDLLGARGDLLASYDQMVAAVERQARAELQHAHTQPSGGRSEYEVLRRGLNETISERTMTPAGLEDWEQTVINHGLVTRDLAPSILLEDLSADLAQLQETLARCRSASALRRLTRVTAQMAGLMCLTFMKMDERIAFRRWARTARLAAHEAGDLLTHSWVRAQEAYGHYYSRDLLEAVHVAQHAQALSGQIPSVGAVLAAALEARAQAALGHRQETRAALRYAETCLSLLDASAIGTSAFDYNEAQLRFHEGNAFAHLHNTSAAWRAQEMALALCPASDYMDRIMIKLDRANCLIYDGDVTGAVAVMVEATNPLTDQQRQGIIAARIRETIAALPVRQQALSAVRDLHDLLPSSPEAKDNF